MEMAGKSQIANLNRQEEETNSIGGRRERRSILNNSSCTLHRRAIVCVCVVVVVCIRIGVGRGRNQKKQDQEDHPKKHSRVQLRSQKIPSQRRFERKNKKHNNIGKPGQKHETLFLTGIVVVCFVGFGHS